MGYMDQIIDQVGETTTLTKVTSNSVDKWGHDSETTEDVEIHGRFEIMRKEVAHEEEGDWQEGDLRAFVHTRWDDDLDIGGKLTYNGRDYRIQRVEYKRLDHNNEHLEVRAEPI